MSSTHKQQVIAIDNLLQNRHYDALQEFIEKTFDDNILSLEAIDTARALRLPATVIYLASLCSENLPDTRPFKKWLAIYSTLASQHATADFDKLDPKSPLRVVALIALGQAKPERLIGCHKKMSEWIEAIELAIDQGQFETLAALVRELVRRQIGTKEWLTLTKAIMQREESLPEATNLNGFANSYTIIRKEFERLDILPNICSHLALRACHVFLKTGNYQAAIEAASHANDGRHKIESSYNAAQAYCYLNEFPQAIRALDQCLASLIQHPDSINIEEKSAASLAFDTEAAGKSLADLQNVLNQVGKRAFLVSGTLLGYAREGQLLAHDKDIDVGIIGWEDQFNILEAIQKSGLFWINFKKIKGQNSYSIPILHLQHRVTIDLFFYYAEDGKLVTGVDHDFGYLQKFAFTLFDLQEIDFLGQKFFAPSDIEKNLEENFGDWRKPDPGYISHLESPSTVDPGGLIHQIVTRIHAIGALTKRKPEKFERVITLMRLHQHRPGGVKDELLAQLEAFSKTLATEPDSREVQ